MKSKNNKTGYIMSVVGFILLLVNAISYIFDLEMKSSSLTILGLIFVVIGLKTRKSNK